MFFWLREIAGWALALLGVWLIWNGVRELQSYDVDPRMIEGSVLCATGVMALRMGVFLIRVATAARIVMVPKGKAVMDSRKEAKSGSAAS